MKDKTSQFSSANYGYGATAPAPQRIERQNVMKGEETSKAQGRLGTAYGGLQAVNAFAAGGTLEKALFRGFTNPVTATAMVANPGARMKQIKADTEMLRNARALDAYEGMPTLNKRSEMTEEMSEQLDLERAIQLTKIAMAVNARLRGDLDIVPSGSFTKVSSAGPVKVTNPLQKEAQVSVHYKTSGPLDFLRSLAGKLPKSVRNVPTAVQNFAEMPIPGTTRIPNKEGLDPLMMGAGLASGGLLLGGANLAYQAGSRAKNKVLENRRFDNMLEQIDLSPPEEGTQRVGAHQDMAEALSADWDGTTERLRTGFKLLNEYAPSVAKNPALALEFSRRLALDPRGTIPPDEYVRQVTDLVRLENSLQSAQPSLWDGGSGGAALKMIG